MFREEPVLKPGQDVVRLWVIEGHLAKLLPENLIPNAVGVLEKSTLKLQMQMALQDATKQAAIYDDLSILMPIQLP
jgi:hypothetical protein